MSDGAASGPASVVERLRAAGCLYAEEEAAVLIEAADDPATRDALVGRRVSGEPLEQVVGWVRFAGLRLDVAPDVFVPHGVHDPLTGAGVVVGADAGPSAPFP